MNTERFRRFNLFLLLGPALSGAVGCGIGATSSIPETVTVQLPDDTVVQVEEGSGAPSLANTKWEFVRTAANGQGAVFAVIRFGPEGNLEAFEENKLASNLFGDEIVFDNTRRATKQAGLSYAAATYGAETRDARGFAFEGRFTAYAAGFVAGEATANATANYDEEDANVVRGTFRFSTKVTLIELPEGDTEDEFSFRGTRIVEDSPSPDQ